MEKKKDRKKMNKLKSFFDFRWWFYDFVKITGFIPIILFLRPKYIYINKNQKKNFKNDSIMIAANHTSLLDPFLMVSVFFFKRVGIIATKELFSTKFKKALFTGFRAICIDKDHVSISTFKEVNQRIKTGHSVGIFPEGTIAHKSEGIDDFKPGVIMMAHMAKTPIYPVYFAKRKSIWQRQKIIIGERFDVAEHLKGMKANSDSFTIVANKLKEKEVELEKYYKGIYG